MLLVSKGEVHAYKEGTCSGVGDTDKEVVIARPNTYRTGWPGQKNGQKGQDRGVQCDVGFCILNF